LHAVDALAEQSAQTIADGLFHAIDQFSAGHPQDDDQTIIVIKGAAT
jgi:sigma-B regulation protein RsbU (phosphoserine phosphatase)